MQKWFRLLPQLHVTYPSCGLAPLKSVADTEPRGSLSWKKGSTQNYLKLALIFRLTIVAISELKVLLTHKQFNLLFLFRNNKI